NLKSYENKGVIISPNMKIAFKKADALIIASNAPEFQKLNNLKNSNKNTIIVDGRRVLKVPKNSKEKYYAIGLSRSS
ncbi:MAG: hypothetical protein HYT36_00730, partial [Candidatus Staskawiczbacteria bacterium]|nr:hypothetical protein [Candidatus Staskawiczbacteria bacterium]